MKESQLIYLSSLPRSGSTLLQRIMATDRRISSASEPWIMLALLNLDHQLTYETMYGRNTAAQAIGDFISGLPGQADYFNDQLKTFALRLYEPYAPKEGFFLDKTPRYYLIQDRLEKLFPEAHFFYLLRDPLSVLASMLKSWIKEDYDRLLNFQVDLVRGPRILANLANKKPDRVIVYEQLLENPEGVMASIYKKLNQNFDPSILNYDNKGAEWSLGDKTSVNKYNSIQNLKNHWSNDLESELHWRLYNSYLFFLGEKTYSKLGYSYEQSQKYIEMAKIKYGHKAGPISISGMSSSEFFSESTVSPDRNSLYFTNINTKNTRALAPYVRIDSAYSAYCRFQFTKHPIKKIRSLGNFYSSIIDLRFKHDGQK